MTNRGKKFIICLAKIIGYIVYGVIYFKHLIKMHNFGITVAASLVGIFFIAFGFNEVLNLLRIGIGMEPERITLIDILVSSGTPDINPRLTYGEKTKIHNALREADYYKTTSTHKYFDSFDKK